MNSIIAKVKERPKMIRSFILIATTIILTVTGQILTKLGSINLSNAQNKPTGIMMYIVKALLNPYIISGLLCAVIAALAWIMALSKLKLSYAYPFMSLSYLLVMFLSGIILKEHISAYQWIGTLFIGIGLVFITKG
jgi:drug/metabolite transporter (DMT)-like permease